MEADAQLLPFRDGEFDAVTSSFGAMFAPDHQAVADELLRVCRPGGTIGMLNVTPEGLASQFFGVFAAYAPPPPPGFPAPVMWGSEPHVRQLFGARVESLSMTRRTYVERAASPLAYREFYKDTFGLAIGTYASLADQPERISALDADFLEFATRANTVRSTAPRSTSTSTCSSSHARRARRGPVTGRRARRAAHLQTGSSRPRRAGSSSLESARRAGRR